MDRQASAEDDRGLRSAFRGFPKDYSQAPLWYWNDDLVPAEIRRQMRDLKQAHIDQVAIFPMAGLAMPYLSPAYFDRFRFAVRTAESLDMRLWIYDDYCWPSGVAGGLINRHYPEHLMPAARFFRYQLKAGAGRAVEQALPEGLLAAAIAIRAGDGRRIDLRAAVTEGGLRWRAPAGAWDISVCVIVKVQRIQDSVTAARWANNLPGYLDVMNRAAVARYIDYVYAGHYRAAPRAFGKTVLGFFTDEPGVWYDVVYRGGRRQLKASPGHDGCKNLWDQSRLLPDEPNLFGLYRAIPWTRDMLAIFRARVGYDLQPHLIDLSLQSEARRRVAYDYFKLVSDLFAENYCAQIGRWCRAHRVAFTGHYGEGASDGDHYRQLKAQAVPGIDLLGNMTTVKDLLPLVRRTVAVARLHRRPRVMCETYGVTPWTYQLADKLYAADLLTVMGINLHMSIDYAYSFRGFRKHTSNPPGFYQSPNWKYQRYFADHLARLGLVTSVGRPAVPVAILYPTTQALSNTLVATETNLQIGRRVKYAFGLCLNSQVEADIVYETALDEFKARNGWLRGGAAGYHTLILPEVEILDQTTVAQLARFVKGGGRLIILHTIPQRRPDGGALAPHWRQAFGFHLPASVIQASGMRRYGRGTIQLVPDPARCFQLSAPCWAGLPIYAFDGDPETEMRQDTHLLPYAVTVDLQNVLSLERITAEIEDVEQQRMEYRFQVSTDNRAWRPLPVCTTTVGKQTALIHGARARYVRLELLKSEGRRYIRVREVTIEYRDPDGKIRRWMPPGYAIRLLADLLPDARPELALEENGPLALQVALCRRRLSAGRDLMIVMNTSDQERTLTGCVKTPRSVAYWDLDSGQSKEVAVTDGRFQVSFSPFEARVFMLQRRVSPSSSRTAVGLDRRRELVREIVGPWPFRPERENAWPLAAGRLWMADPVHPDKWIPCVHGVIPPDFRLTPMLLFRGEIQADYISGTEKLLLEDRLYMDLRVNRRAIGGQPGPCRYYDQSGYMLPVGRLLKRGRNVIEGVFTPEIYERDTRGACYHYAKGLGPTLDAFLLGQFAVRDDRLTRPVGRLDCRPWEQQGYQYYSGTGIYTLALPPNPQRHLWLEVGARGGVVELRIQGRTVGVRIAEPYLFDVGRYLTGNRPMLAEVRVTGTLGALFSCQIENTVGARGRSRHASGLEFARLMHRVAS